MFEETSSNRNPVLLVIFLIVIAIIVFFIIRGGILDTNSKELITQTSKGGVVTSFVNLAVARNEEEKYPPGFPTFIPVEVDGVKESYSMNYEEQNSFQYSLSYLSKKTISEKFMEYESFMTQSGFDVKKDPENFLLFGTKSNDDLSIVITSREEGTFVTLTYLDRI